jgi:hypothetical protein
MATPVATLGSKFRFHGIFLKMWQPALSEAEGSHT